MRSHYYGLKMSSLIAVPKIREHLEVGRTLKTAPSIRDVPFVGAALWAAQRALKHSSKHKGWLFHFGLLKASCVNRYNMKLATFSNEKRSSHSFRHSMVTRLNSED